MGNAKKIIEFIQAETKALVSLSAEHCYGACDYPPNIASLLAKDEKIFHFGEAPIPSLSLPSNIIFFEAKSRYKIEPLLSATTRYLEGEKIGIITASPFMHTLKTLSTYLKKQGYSPLIGKKGKRASYPGQILGCDLTAATTIQSHVDSYLYVGDGNFHPLGISLATKKPVIALDPAMNQVKRQEIATLREKILRQRNSALARAHDADIFGIIICKKIGQERSSLAYHLKGLLERNQKKVFLIHLDMITPSKLDYLSMDCFVSTACPRIAIDDYSLFKKPILTPLELEILLGRKEWESYKFDQIL
jgi:2-(3-amino-3-carboxypropyl)histidine synthase